MHYNIQYTSNCCMYIQILCDPHWVTPCSTYHAWGSYERCSAKHGLQLLMEKSQFAPEVKFATGSFGWNNKKRIQGQSGIDPRNWNSCFFAEWCFCCNPSEHPAKVDLFRVKFLFHGLEFSFQQLWSSCLARRPVWFFKSHRLRNGVTIKLPLATYLQGVPPVH